MGIEKNQQPSSRCDFENDDKTQTKNPEIENRTTEQNNFFKLASNFQHQPPT